MNVEYRLHCVKAMRVIKNFGAALALALVCSTQLVAQTTTTRMGGLALSVYSGGAAHSDLQRSAARAEWPVAGVTQSREFARRLSPATAPALGMSAAYWPSQWWGIRASAGLVPTRFEVTVSDREKAGLPADSVLVGTTRYAGLRVWTYDVELMFRAPFTPRQRIVPYGLIGGGAVRYQSFGEDPLPPEARSAFGSGNQPTRAAAVIGVGALVPLQRNNLALSFELTDHLVRTPIERTGGSELDGSGIRLTTDPTAEPGDGRVTLTSHVRLLIGLTWIPR